MKHLPSVIYTGKWRGGHIQGIAIDQERNYIYCSFTTEFVKLDMQGNLIGSVKGFTGHLGCLAYHAKDGRVYASLEYKNDAIGQSILRNLGIQREIRNAFYVAIFDVDKIDHPGMDAQTDGVVTTVWLREPTEDYLADGHRYGCSGIDGITFAPIDGEERLLVAYGIYNDVNRTDNDHQVLIAYRPEGLKAYESVLTADHIHTTGPDHCDERYFVYTGNTNYGIQNLEYDPFTGNIFMAVYRGQKEHFPNFKMYVIDGNIPPQKTVLKGLHGETGLTLTLKNIGLYEKNMYGSHFKYGSTGMIALGDGTFYFSEDHSENGEHDSHIRLYRYTGEDMLFEPIADESSISSFS